MNRAERRRQERLAKKSQKGKSPPEVTIESRPGYFVGRFTAMASPCEVLVETDLEQTARRMTKVAAEEALRIERKFSRYAKTGVVAQIHEANGEPVEVDAETSSLLDFAGQCYEMSDGLFDITSGVLRQVWTFDGSDNLPKEEAVQDILDNIGWGKLTWDAPYLTLPLGMEVDFGGIGKEYAVDKIAQMIANVFDESFVVNLGGDMSCPRSRDGGKPWKVGVESPSGEEGIYKELELRSGALATSGNARRFLVRDGIRYSHILNPKTGWPIEKAPSSVTVAAETCVEAGMLATLASLQGEHAEEFLAGEGVKNWIVR